MYPRFYHSTCVLSYMAQRYVFLKKTGIPKKHLIRILKSPSYSTLLCMNPPTFCAKESDHLAQGKERSLLYLRPNSYLDRLLTLLTVTGEYPYRSLSLLGNRRVLTTLVRSLQQPQFVQIPNASPVSCRILSVSGHGAYKTIRLHRSAFPLLQHLYPGALQTYLRVTRQHRFAGGTEHVGRNHRIAETTAMCMMAGIEIRPSFLAPLATATQPYTTAPSFYLARFLKQELTGLNKTIFTRITGMLLSPTQSYALYNARQSKMKWNGMGEFKALQLLRDVSYTATGQASDSAILFGASPDNLPLSDEQRFDSIYPNIHFVPLDRNGVALLRLLCLPHARARLQSLLFPAEICCTGVYIECDAQTGNRCILSCLDGNIARLLRFKEAALFYGSQYDYEVLCYPWQQPFVQSYMETIAAIRVIPMEQIQERISVF